MVGLWMVGGAVDDLPVREDATVRSVRGRARGAVRSAKALRIINVQKARLLQSCPRNQRTKESPVTLIGHGAFVLGRNPASIKLIT